jgi:DnaJ-class molecular chaperone
MSPEAETFLAANSTLIREAFLEMEQENAAWASQQPDCSACSGNGGFSTGEAWPYDWRDCRHCEGRGFTANPCDMTPYRTKEHSNGNRR